MNIDGEGAVLGRLATHVAKQLLSGESVTIVNAGKIIITGNPTTTKEKYAGRREIGSPHHGPFFPKTPEGIVKRAIRGMLPYKTPKGRQAFKRLRVHVRSDAVGDAASLPKRDIRTRYTTVEDLSKFLGWKG